MNPVIERHLRGGGNDLLDSARTSSLTETPNMYIFSESSNRALDHKYHFSYLPPTQLGAPGARSCCLTFLPRRKKSTHNFQRAVAPSTLVETMES